MCSPSASPFRSQQPAALVHGILYKSVKFFLDHSLVPFAMFNRFGPTVRSRFGHAFIYGGTVSCQLAVFRDATFVCLFVFSSKWRILKKTIEFRNSCFLFLYVVLFELYCFSLLFQIVKHHLIFLSSYRFDHLSKFNRIFLQIYPSFLNPVPQFILHSTTFSILIVHM